MSLSLDFVSELKKGFSGDIRLDDVSRVLYSTDASLYQIEPLGVVIPRTQDDLIAVVELASKYRIPVLPRGSGSSLGGQAIGEAVIIDCSRYLDHVLGVNIDELTASVEPGVVLATLNRRVASHGLMFGPDPASAERATMGGVIGNNATGAHSIRYGMTADHLLSADVILADGSLATWGGVSGEKTTWGVGERQRKVLDTVFNIREKYANEIRENWPKAWRNSAGYRLNYLLPWSASKPEQWEGEYYPPLPKPGEVNLAALLAGSEGTLAVIRKATVNLVRKPKHTILGVLVYKSIVEACEAVPALLMHKPSAVELLPKMIIRLARSVPAYASQLGFVQGDPEALLVVEFSGDDTSLLREKVLALRRDVLVAEGAEEQARVWNVRKVGLGILDSRPTSARPVAFIEDCAIPVERLGEFVVEVDRILMAHNTQAAFYAHASAGCLHIRPILDLKTEPGVRNLRSIAEQVLAVTLRIGGAMSSEHGDGLVRSEWLIKTYGDTVLDAMKQIKLAADPLSLMNPKNLTNAPAMDTNLRYGTDYHSKAWTPSLDFSRNGGVTGAVEQCNGQGVCRKLDGVMCPSFQVTREEMHSTRGRANLLRAMISIGKTGIPAEQVKQALDLCLACKGCKAECPSGVDMAKLKYEFQSYYYHTHSRPLRDYFFGYIGLFARFGSPFSRMANWLMEMQLIRKIAFRYLGLGGERLLPKFGNHQSLDARRREIRLKQKINGDNFEETCLFLADTFTHYFEPEIEKSALDVLIRCGIQPHILPIFGAGRTLLSKGFIEPARRHLTSLLDEICRLDPTSNLAVVGLEPSEIYTLRDELLDLLPERREEILSLIGRAWLIDEYLIRPKTGEKLSRISGQFSGNTKGLKSKILLHGHCYQKAQPPHSDGIAVGVNASVELLQAVGYEVEVIASGCCGMAGAFGYESEHYEVSMQVGELRLFPQIRKAVSDGNLLVAAPGTSCRSQIVDGTGVKARHTIKLVAQILKV